MPTYNEMYDLLSASTADYNYTLVLAPQSAIRTVGKKNQTIHVGQDGSEERISLSTTSVFYVMFAYNAISEADNFTLFDLYHDTVKANGIARTFYWTNVSEVTDQHTYTVRFDCDLEQIKQLARIWGYAEIRLKIIGKHP